MVPDVIRSPFFPCPSSLRVADHVFLWHKGNSPFGQTSGPRDEGTLPTFSSPLPETFSHHQELKRSRRSRVWWVLPEGRPCCGEPDKGDLQVLPRGAGVRQGGLYPSTRYTKATV